MRPDNFSIKTEASYLGERPQASFGGAGRVLGRRCRVFVRLQNAVFPSAACNPTGGIAHCTLALPTSVDKASGVDIAIGIGGGAHAVDFTLEPVAGVAKSILHFDVSFTRALPFDKAADIGCTVTVSRLAGAVAFAIFPVALVAITVGKGHNAIAVILRILKAALIDQAIGISSLFQPLQ